MLKPVQRIGYLFKMQSGTPHSAFQFNQISQSVDQMIKFCICHGWCCHEANSIRLNARSKVIGLTPYCAAIFSRGLPADGWLHGP